MSANVSPICLVTDPFVSKLWNMRGALTLGPFETCLEIDPVFCAVTDGSYDSSLQLCQMAPLSYRLIMPTLSTEEGHEVRLTNDEPLFSYL